MILPSVSYRAAVIIIPREGWIASPCQFACACVPLSCQSQTHPAPMYEQIGLRAISASTPFRLVSKRIALASAAVVICCSHRTLKGYCYIIHTTLVHYQVPCPAAGEAFIERPRSCSPYASCAARYGSSAGHHSAFIARSGN